MTPERWKQAQAALDDVLEKPPEERDAAIEGIADPTLRHEVLSLIRAIETRDTRLDRGPSVPAEILQDVAPTEAGPYRLLQPLGEGGMGTVYLAERQDRVHHKKVAVKLLRAGFIHPELERRFRGEREILAHLEHPHIARLLDGGATTEGRPYLVMEHVEGEVLDRYCDRLRLEIPERLALFLKVCDAVQYAHRNLVVHRDLKPGNILVNTDGEPKLLDFGIAKLLSPDSLPMTMVQTRTGGGPMTPAYASPEQLLGKSITTASDVYSLGVLLYELLTGRRPYETRGSGLDTIVQQLDGTPPTMPSQSVQQNVQAAQSAADKTSASQLAALRSCDPRQLQHQLRGDLDSIVLKALAPMPEDRYASAEQLADDLLRHRQGLPVRAREGTATYRATKFVKRHRWAVGSASAVFLLLVGFIVILLDQQQEILAQSRQATSTSDYLSKIFYTIDPISGSGTDLKATDLLDRGYEQLDTKLAELPRVQANLLAVMGRAYFNLGRLERSHELLERSLTMRRRLLGDDHPEVGESERLMCLVLDGMARHDAAEAACRRALAIAQNSPEEDPRALMESQFRLARVLTSQDNEHGAAAELFQQAVDIARRLDDVETLSQILNSYGVLQARLHQHQDALQSYRESLDIVRREWGDDHPRLGVLLGNMSKVYRRLGDEEQAAETLRQAEAQHRRIYPDGHPQLALTLYHQGMAFREQGNGADAEAKYLEALAMYQRHLEPTHTSIANVKARLASLYRTLERLPEAEELGLDALRIYRKRLGSDNNTTADMCTELAGIYRDLKRYDEAEALYQEGLDIYLQSVGERHQLTATLLSNFATLLNHRRKWQEALPLYQQALETFIELNGPETRDISILTYNVANTQHRVGEHTAAQDNYLRAMAMLRKVSGDDHPALIVMGSRLGHLYLDLGDLERAAELSSQVEDLAAVKVPAGHRFERAARHLRGRLLLLQGNPDEAASIVRPLFDSVRRSKGLDDNETRDLLDLLITLYETLGDDEQVDELQRLRSPEASDAESPRAARTVV